MGSDQKRAFLAVILSGIVLFTWQTFFAPKPALNSVKEKTVAEKNIAGVNHENNTQKMVKPLDQVSNNSLNQNLEKFTINNENYSITINNKLEVLNFESRDSVFNFKEIVGDKIPLTLKLRDNNQTFFNFESKTQNSVLKGESLDKQTKLTLNLDEQGKLNFSFYSSTPQKFQIDFASSEAQLENGQTRNYIYLLKDTDIQTVGDDSSASGGVRWAGIDYNFHIFALVFDKVSPAGIRTKQNGEMTVALTDSYNELTGSLIFTKKSYDHLESLGSNLHLAVDFGILGIIAVPILRGLQFFYKYIPNYGIAIILLTLIIRLITFPLQWKSFKSMKKMQKIQPEITKLKEKYKDEPQKMQQETMALFKKAGANPLGGCLPMVAQMPIFFAFYKVLYAAVELVEAPFLGWINDLSVKDPYFVLPILMTVVMFLQQKLNPSVSTDPTQTKVLMFMPLIFGFIMKDLPAGLVLYICVSTVFGIIQQLFVYKTVD